MSASHEIDMVGSQWSIFLIGLHSLLRVVTFQHVPFPSHSINCMTVLSCWITLKHGDFCCFACIAHTSATSCSSPSCSASLSMQSPCCTDHSGARNISLARQGTCRTCGGICTVVLDQRRPCCHRRWPGSLYIPHAADNEATSRLCRSPIREHRASRE